MRIGSIVVAVAAALLAAAPAWAAQPIQPWDGANPFNCVLQDVGLGTDFPDPDADPLCVEFDKTRQNVVPELGLVDFLLNEPGRVAAALPACFYYQHDHWTGSVIQDNGTTELWHWDGSYFFDKARALGGVHVENFRIGGRPVSAYPYVPAEYKPYVEREGGGGVWLAGEVPADPACAARVDHPSERAAIYRSAPKERECIDAPGRIGRRSIGPLRLGTRTARAQRRLGEPTHFGNRFRRWCVSGGGAIGDSRDGARSALVITSAAGHTIRGAGPRTGAKRAKRRLGARPRFRVAGSRVFRIRHRGVPAYAGIRKGKLRWLALRSRELVGTRAELRKRLRGYLRRDDGPVAVPIPDGS